MRTASYRKIGKGMPEKRIGIYGIVCLVMQNACY
jgi:hypothetical protein